MIYAIIALSLIFIQFRLSRFQFLLLLCFIEVKTGFLIGDYYFAFVLFSYLLFRYLWWLVIRAPVAQRN